MATVVLPNSFSAGTLAVAAEVNANFAAVLAQLNGNVDEDNLASSIAQRTHEPGDLKISARSAPSSGWLLCDGSAVSRSTFADLFAAIGTVYGVGDGSTTFNLPDLRGRVAVAPDGAAGRLTANETLGDVGGEEKHALSVAELAAHTHGDGTLAADNHTHDAGTYRTTQSHFAITTLSASGDFARTGASQGMVEVGDTGGNVQQDITGDSSSAGAGVSGATGSTGSGNGHNTMQPYLVVNTFIKT